MRKIVKDSNFIHIQGWMLDLGISGNELIVYALIYGFSQEQEGQFYQASLSYIMEWLQVGSKHTVINVIKKLVEKGLIKKESKVLNNVTFNKYSAVKPQLRGSAENALPVQNCDGGSAENALGSAKSAPNNIIDNTINNNSSNSPDINISPIPTEPPLLFPTEITKTPKGEKSKIIDLSFVRADLLPLMIEWMDYRKEIKKPIKTQAGIKLNYRDLLNYSGGDVNLARKVVETSISRGWTGLQPLKQDNYGNPTSRPTDAQMLRAAIDQSWGPGGDPLADIL